MNTTYELIAAIKNGEMVILMDDEDRENEGDLIMSARHVNAQFINFMATHARGLICLALPPAVCDKLNLPLMVDEQQNSSPNKTNFTVSIEAAEGVTTGISAADRAKTIQTAARGDACPEDFCRPGHVFPLRGHSNGLHGRNGHTESALELSRLAGDTPPAAVLVEIMSADGSMARKPELEVFARQHKLVIGTVADILDFLTS